MGRARIRHPESCLQDHKTTLSLPHLQRRCFLSFFLSSFHGSPSTPKIVPWQQLKPSRACGLCLMKPILTLCESSPLGSQCPSCWMTPLVLLAHSLLLSSVGEREYLRGSGGWTHFWLIWCCPWRMWVNGLESYFSEVKMKFSEMYLPNSLPKNLSILCSCQPPWCLTLTFAGFVMKYFS